MTSINLSNEMLRATIKDLVAAERLNFIAVIDHLGEIEARSLINAWGYSSLWDYCTRELGLKDGVAFNRITLARFIRQRPEIRELLIDGSLGQSTATVLAKHADSPEFETLLEAATGKSKQEFLDFLAERGNAPAPQRDTIRRMGPKAKQETPPASDHAARSAASPSAEVINPPDVSAPANASQSNAEPPKTPQKNFRISFMASEETVAKLKRAQDLAGTSELETVLAQALSAYLEKKDPACREERREKRRAKKSTEERAAAPTPTSATSPNPGPDSVTDPAPFTLSQLTQAKAKAAARRQRYVSRPHRDSVFVRDQLQCSYVSPDGTRCQSRRHLEVDHIWPAALGGTSSDEVNLRPLCRAHNLMRARETFGAKVPRRRSTVADEVRRGH